MNAVDVYQRSGYYGPPTHICAVCGEKEFKDADIACDRFWLCEECKEALTRLVEQEKLSIRRERIMKQLEDDGI